MSRPSRISDCTGYILLPAGNPCTTVSISGSYTVAPDPVSGVGGCSGFVANQFTQSWTYSEYHGGDVDPVSPPNGTFVALLENGCGVVGPAANTYFGRSVSGQYVDPVKGNGVSFTFQEIISFTGGSRTVSWVGSFSAYIKACGTVLPSPTYTVPSLIGTYMVTFHGGSLGPPVIPESNGTISMSIS